MYTHILVATDGSELAQKAVDHGTALAKALGAKLTIITVSEPWAAIAPGEVGMAFPIEDYEKGAADNAARILTAASAAAKAGGVTCATQHVKDRFPAEGIIEASKTLNADLIVMASHGRRGVSRLLLGSQANRVVTHSDVPVLICR